MSQPQEPFTRGINLINSEVEVFSGRLVDVLNPKATDIDIIDIAHSLSMQCRFNGHTSVFYSVGEHCALMMDWILATHKTPSLPHLALSILLHDATEAYLCDIPRPVKLYLPEYKKWEKNFENVISQKYGVLLGTPFIKQCDNRIVHNEREILLPNGKNNVWTIPGTPLEGLKIQAWSPSEAKYEFLTRYNEMTAAIAKAYPE
jgi:uncharacterized protein